MTAVANPLAFPQVSRPSWSTINGNSSMNTDEVRGMFAPRKTLSRNNSTSSISSDSSNTSVATNGSHSSGTPFSSTSEISQWSANAPQRKRPQPKNPWPAGKGVMSNDFPRTVNARPNGMPSHSVMQQSAGGVSSQMTQQGMARPAATDQLQGGQPVLYLLSLNGTFERKTLAVPFSPDSLRIGRQTNQKTVPTPANGFFDSKVLSRQHAEIYAENNGKIFIRDVKSSNGTFVNGTRLSQENRESEPHELQTADHLELGIDIVSEDQKTVVHHKVAAKVEHAGFLPVSNNVLDLSFGDLDPANGSMMMPPGAMQTRGRQVYNIGMGPNGRMMHNGAPNNNQANNGLLQQRSFFMTPIATDQIMKRLAVEMRNAKLQAQDLGRTNQFVSTLLSKENLKDLEKSEVQEAPKLAPLVNGNGMVLRNDAKTRFSDPPAPPPQQPLPEKPDVSGLKRFSGERPKLGHAATSSPIRQDNIGQIIQLTEALNNAKRDIDSQTARMRELEAMLNQEREARTLAEELAIELAIRSEESVKSQMDCTIFPDVQGDACTAASASLIEDAEEILEPLLDDGDVEEKSTKEADNVLETRLFVMDAQIKEFKDQMEQWRARCETAESERDAGRKSLAEMVTKLREQEALRVEAEERARSRSRQRSRESRRADREKTRAISAEAALSKGSSKGEDTRVDDYDLLAGSPTLSRANTITSLNPQRWGTTLQEDRLHSGLPYASMLGVVLIGMGMMAVINGWQSPALRLER